MTKLPKLSIPCSSHFMWIKLTMFSKHAFIARFTKESAPEVAASAYSLVSLAVTLS